MVHLLNIARATFFGTVRVRIGLRQGL